MWPGAISTSFSCKSNWKWLQPNNSIKVEGNYCIDCLTWRTIMVLVYYNWFSITLVLHRKVQIKFRKLKARLRLAQYHGVRAPVLSCKNNPCEQGWPCLCKKQKCYLHSPKQVSVCVSSTDKNLGPRSRTGGRTRSPARGPTIYCERCCRKE